MSKGWWKTVGAVSLFLLLIGVMVYVNVVPDNVLNKPLPSAVEVWDGLKEGSAKVYNRFLEGEGGGEPSGAVVNPDSKFLIEPKQGDFGWVYQVGNKTIMWDNEVEFDVKTGKGIVIASPNLNVVEDDKPVRREEAKSLKNINWTSYKDVQTDTNMTVKDLITSLNESLGSSVTQSLLLSASTILNEKVDFGNIVVDDFNYTSKTFRVGLRNNTQGNLLKGLKLPVKFEGEKYADTSLDAGEYSQAFTVTNPDGILGFEHNTSFNPSDSVVGENNNWTMMDTEIRAGEPDTNFGGSTSAYVYYYAASTQDMYINSLYALAYTGGTPATVVFDNYTVQLYVNNYWEATQFDWIGLNQTYLENNGTTTLNMNGSWRSPDEGWQHPTDGSARWTTGDTPQDDIKPDFRGCVLNHHSTNANKLLYYGFDMNASCITQNFKENNGWVHLYGRATASVGDGTLSVNTFDNAANQPVIRFSYTMTNNPPSNPAVSLSPLDSFSSVDVYCVGTVNDTDVETDLTGCVDLLKNNVSQYIECGLPVTNNVDFNYTITAVGNFSVGDEWGCGVLIDDQAANSSWVNASQFTMIQNRVPVCTQSDTNITVLEDSGVWTLDANMSLTINISCSDPDGTALTYDKLNEIGSGGSFTNPNNDDLIFTTGVNATGTKTVTYNISDGSLSTLVSAQVIVNEVDDNPWWDEIINGSTTKLKTGYGYQPINVNASQYFRDVEDDQTPANITISVNESSVDCMMNTVSNFSIFCNPDSVSTFIITLNEPNAGSNNFEEYVAYPPSTPVITLPITATYHGNNTLAWTASISPQGDEIAFYNLTINFGPVPYTDWYYSIAMTNSTSYSWDSREIIDSGLNEYYLQVDVCDNDSLCTYGLSSGFSVNNTPHWDNIGNATALNIYTLQGKQPVLSNVSQYFHDYFDDQTPDSIIADDNETGISCTIETNLSLFCTPTAFKGDYIITLNGTNSVANSSFESIEGYVDNSPPTTPTTIIPEDKALNDTEQLRLECSGSTDPESDTIYYDFYDNTNTVICLNTGGECLWNITDHTTNTWLYWKCLSNDTYENSSSTTLRGIRTETWDVINQTQTYNDFLVSSTNIILESNVTWNEIRYNNIIAYANISGTYYTTTKTQHDNWTHFIVSIPFNQTEENPQGFTWTYNLTYLNSSTFTNDSYGGSIPYTNLYLMNCSDTNTSILLNVTGLHEDTAALLGISLKGIFEIWSDNYEFRNTQTFDLNATDYNVTDGIDSYYFCLSYDTPVNLSSYMQYSTPGGFAQRWYINKQAYQNNTNNEIHLYDLDYTAGMNELKGTVRYKDSYSYFQNVYTQLWRYHPSVNGWKYVQSDRSDEFGLVDFNIKEIVNDYKLLFYDSDNHLLLQTTSSKFTCDPTTYLCEITFLLDSWGGGVSTYKTPLAWSYDNATGIISVTWNDPASTISSLRVLVTKETMGGTTTVCDGTTASASGTYTCNVTDYSGTLLLRAYQTASPESNALIWEVINRPISALFQFLPLQEGVVWAVSLSVTTALFGIIISPAAGIIMFLAALVIISMMGLAGFVTIGFITAAVIIGIIIGLKVRS